MAQAGGAERSVDTVQRDRDTCCRSCRDASAAGPETPTPAGATPEAPPAPGSELSVAHRTQVLPVTTRRMRRDFLDLPWRLYRDDPNWVPPLRMDQKELAGFHRHPFYDRNEIQTFVAYRGGVACGRIAAIVNVVHNERYNQQLGFFGFFECIDDEDVAGALFDAARAWLAERGLRSIRGPVNPSLNYTLGTLIEGFDDPPCFMMTYNPPYYGRLIESYGFSKTQDLYAFWGHVSMLPKVQAKLAPMCEKILDHCQARVRSLDPKRFREEVQQFLEIYNHSLTNTWGFVPMSQREVEHVAAGLRYLIVPELAVGVEVDGRLVGASFGLPDYNPRIKAIDGRLFPFGFLRLLRRKDRIKKIRVISTNVLPEFQMQGLGLCLLDGLVPKAIEWGIQEAEFSWVLESNSFSRGALAKGGAQVTKTYRIYDYDESN